MESLWQSVWRAMRLDESFFKMTVTDESYSNQSNLIVLLSSAASGLGAMVYYGIGPGMITALFHFMMWYVLVFALYWIGGKWLKESGTTISYNALIRVMGFAAAPGLIRALAVVPGLGEIVAKVGYIWILVAFVVAARQALNYQSQVRTIIVCLLTWSVPFLMPLLVKSVSVMFAGGETGASNF